MGDRDATIRSAEEWVRFVFDRPVCTEPYEAWLLEQALNGWSAADRPVEAIAYLTSCCAQAARLLSPYRDDQLASGFSYVLAFDISDYQSSLLDEQVSLDDAVQCISSMTAVFAALLDVRLRDASLCDATHTGLALTCVRWWIWLARVDGMAHVYGSRRREVLATAAIEAQSLILRGSRSEFCAASALWGLRQWGMVGSRRAMAEPVVQKFLTRRDRLGRALRQLAAECLEGPVSL